MFIKKVAVNSGGKHCLALSSEGEVYSWGEAEDGKLGHGNRRYYVKTSFSMLCFPLLLFVCFNAGTVYWHFVCQNNIYNNLLKLNNVNDSFGRNSFICQYVGLYLYDSSVGRKKINFEF